jgi:predicted  nucleic acid-binding Zn-ribbon protein
MSLDDALEAMRSAVLHAEAKTRALEEQVRRLEKVNGDLEDQIYDLQRMVSDQREAAE